MTLPTADESGLPAGTHQLKAGAALSYVSMALGFVIAMAYTPFVLRQLGQSEYGLYSLVASLVGYLGLVALGLNSAYLRLHARYREQRDGVELARVNAMFLMVFAALGLLVVVGGWLLVTHAGTVLGDEVKESELGTSRVLFAIMSGGVALSLPLAVFEAHVIASERFVFQKMLVVARTLAVPVIILPLLFAGYGSVGMAAATTLITLAAQVYTAVFSRRVLKIGFVFSGLRVSMLKETIVFSSYVFAAIVVDQINWNVDKYIVGLFWGTASVAIYGVASLLNMYFMSLSASVSGVFAPRVHQMVAAREGDDGLSRLFGRVGRIQFALLAGVLVEFVLFGKPFVLWWAGSGYADAYAIALLLMVPATIPLIQNLGIEIQRAKNLHHFRSWVYLGIAVANVLLSIVLVREIGPVGAAIGTAASLLVGNGLIMNWYYGARVGLDIRHFWREIGRLLPSLVPTVGVGLVLVLLLDLGRPALLVSAMVVVGVVYVASMWRLGLDAGERALIPKPSTWAPRVMAITAARRRG